MKILVLYDSFFGNTEKIANTIADSAKDGNDVILANVANFNDEYLKNLDLLVVGSPTRGFSASENTKSFLNKLPKGALNGIKIASFDTRVDIKKVNSKFLTFMVGLFGYAAEPIEKKLKSKGGQSIIKPEGFFVNDKEGPLLEGEIEKAQKWTKDIISSSK